MELVTIYWTAATREEALAISRVLLEERLVACANIFPGMVSVYQWGGEVCQSEEVAVFVKTTREQASEVTACVESLHSYECPCVVVWDVIGGSSRYARWVAGEVTKA